MRYIGNKTKLVPFLLTTVRELGLVPGIACDPFAGTASVARALKANGWRVHCGDLLALSYAYQVARVEIDRTPAFPASLIESPTVSRRAVSYAAVLRALQRLPPSPGFLTEHYTPAGRAGGAHGRMYFTPENAALIDAIRSRIASWAETSLGRQREQLLLATLIQAADRVANTTGVYASFVKTWQPNAVRPLGLRPIRPTIPPGDSARGCTTYRGGAGDLVRRVGSVDLLYLDPPYNERQYPGYYHLPELLAQGWSTPPTLRGKTGLIPDEDLRSDWCRRGRGAEALRTLLDGADARHILLSYNDEGLIAPEQIEHIFRAGGEAETFRCFERGYPRYRSDADRPGRRYRGDTVRERVYYVRRP